jgi:hypothetical protein
MLKATDQQVPSAATEKILEKEKRDYVQMKSKVNVQLGCNDGSEESCCKMIPQEILLHGELGFSISHFLTCHLTGFTMRVNSGQLSLDYMELVP